MSTGLPSLPYFRIGDKKLLAIRTPFPSHLVFPFGIGMTVIIQAKGRKEPRGMRRKKPLSPLGD
jgi:hypothetical protein